MKFKEILFELENFVEENNIPFWGKNNGDFLKNLVKITKPTIILEFGTETGYSTLKMLEGLHELNSLGSVRVLTFDYDSEISGNAKKWVEKFGESAVKDFHVEFYNAHSNDINNYVRQNVDLIVFNHDWKEYGNTLELVSPLLSDKAVIVSNIPVQKVDSSFRDFLNNLRINFSSAVYHNETNENSIIEVSKKDKDIYFFKQLDELNYSVKNNILNISEVEPETDIAKKEDAVLAIQIYNRPALFAVALRALKEQVKDVDVYLYPDYPSEKDVYNLEMPPSVIEKLIEAQIEMFKDAIPHGEVKYDHGKHLGHILNQKRALMESWESHEKVLMMKDDQVIHPNYLEMLFSLMNKLEGDERIGIVSCFGDLQISVEEQETRIKELKGAGNLGLWGTWRSRWEKVSTLFDYYWEVMNDYQINEKISREEAYSILKDWLEKLGFPFVVDESRTFDGMRSTRAIFSTQRLFSVSTSPNYLVAVGGYFSKNHIDQKWARNRAETEYFTRDNWQWDWNEEIFERVAIHEVGDNWRQLFEKA